MWVCFFAGLTHGFGSILQAFTCNDPRPPPTNPTYLSPRLPTAVAGDNREPYSAPSNQILKEARETQGEHDRGGRGLGSYERRRGLIHFLVYLTLHACSIVLVMLAS